MARCYHGGLTRTAAPDAVNRTAADPHPALAHALRTAGLALRRHPRRIATLQGLLVVVYAAVVLVPVLLPGSGPAWLAQFMNWGLWWPLAILSVLLAGRAWCGLLCPEGALTEWVSRRGLGRPIPPWMRRGGWPLAGFVAVTLYGQLADVYASPSAAALLLGGSTATALLVGLLYGPRQGVRPGSSPRQAQIASAPAAPIMRHG